MGYLVRFFEHGKVAEFRGRFTPGFNELKGFVAGDDGGGGVINDLHHLVEEVLIGDINKEVLTILNTGLNEGEGEELDSCASASINGGIIAVALDHESLLEGFYYVLAIDISIADGIT